MCCRLVSRGYSWHDLTDERDGMTIEQIVDANVEAERIAKVEEMLLVHAMNLAVGGLFAPNELKKYFSKGQSVLRRTAPSGTSVQADVAVEKIKDSMIHLQGLTDFLVRGGKGD